MSTKPQSYSAAQHADLNTLLERHAPLVQRIAYHLMARLPPSVQVDDLIQAGLMGLLNAAGHYDPSQGASFETYAAIRVRGAMLDELRRNDWAPKSVHRRARDMVDAMRQIESGTGREAKPHEIAAAMDLSLDEYHQLVLQTNTCRVLNFAEVESDDENLGESIADERDHGPLRGIERDEFRRHLTAAIKQLPEREQLIVSLYYDEELNLKEIGGVLGVSESRVSQLLSQAHLRMRGLLQEFIQSASSAA
ncbi:MAG: RNA polymerase sigma factor FliA [Gammaproteobacteria bacterium]|nr:RNA polymerase sigma factor FliA [Gammaproteobacteria bacterium]